MESERQGGVAGTWAPSGGRVWFQALILPVLGAGDDVFKLRSQVDLGVVITDPNCIGVVVRQKDLIHRNSVLFWVRPGGEEVQGQMYSGSGPVGSSWFLELSLGL